MSNVKSMNSNKPVKSLMGQVFSRENRVRDCGLDSTNNKKTSGNFSLDKITHIDLVRSMLFKRFEANLSTKDFSTPKNTENSRLPKPLDASKTLLSCSSYQISNNNISEFQEPAKPKLSYRKNPEEHVAESDSALLTNTRFIRPNLKKSKSGININKNKEQSVSVLELTPLSRLIEQSYRDIQILQEVHTTRKPKLSEKHTTSQEGLNLPCYVPLKDEKGKKVDISKVEENLKKFENLYSQFLQHNGNEGDPAEEVHLLAMVYKRSETIT